MVVTGLGMVTPLGNDVETSWSNLIAGESGAAEIKQFDASEFPVHFAARAEGLRPDRRGSSASRRGAWTASRR